MVKYARWLSGKQSACTVEDAGDTGWDHGSGRSPPRFAPAPHASGPPRGRGGDEVRVGAGERAAWPRLAPGLGG